MRVQNGTNGSLGSQFLDLTLGTLTAEQAFPIVAGCNASKLAGAMIGAAAQIAYLQRPVAAGYFRIGQDSAAASIFSGTITGLRIFVAVPLTGTLGGVGT